MMDRQKVIELARKAGLAYGSDEKPLSSVERFAALIEAEMCKHQADKFCETHCSWTDHHVDCDQVRGDAEPVACIATNGALMWLKKPEALYSKPVPLFKHPAAAVVRQLVEALEQLMSIVKIHSRATSNNFAWAEMDFAKEALAAVKGADV